MGSLENHMNGLKLEEAETTSIDNNNISTASTSEKSDETMIKVRFIQNWHFSHQNFENSGSSVIKTSA